MSDVEELRARLAALSSDLQQTAGALKDFTDGLDTQVEGIDSLIGDTVSGADREIGALFHEAKEAVEAAADALFEAGDDAERYAARI